MAVTYTSLLLRNQAATERRLVEDHLRLARETAVRMLHHADSNGQVPDTAAVRRRIGNDVWREVLEPYYIGPTGEALHGADPQSPFARVVVDGIQRATRIQVERQAALVRQAVNDPAIADWLTGPRPAALMFAEPETNGQGGTAAARFAGLRGPDGRIDFARARADLVRPRGFYDPFHRWVDPKGHVLSERVWNTAEDVRERIDRMLSYHISRGTGAVEIARELEQFLTPGARGQKTVKPYGTEGSYAARRLARTEITVAAHRASVSAALVNPMVQGVKWSLSPSHPEYDICDEYAKGGPNGDGIYPPYDVPEVPHPHCLCHQSPIVHGDRSEVVDRLRDEIQGARADLLGALDPESAARLQGILNPEFLTDAIMHGTLDESVRDAVTQVQQQAQVVVAPTSSAATPEEPTPRPGMLDDGFPDDLDRLVKVQDLGGSTGAILVRDPLDDRRYVLKRGNDPDHLREEVAADRAYQALGVNVPPLHLYETDAGPVKLAEFIEGRTLRELRASAPTAYQKALAKVRKDFAADALLGNWDVVGLDFDNILVDTRNRVWRIDNGGALRRRAQGQMKADIAPWNQYVDEIWTLRDANINRQAAEVFGALDYEEITKQLRRVSRKQTAVLDVLPDDLKALMQGRFEIAKDLVKISNTFSKDNWQFAYIDDFSRHSVGVRKAGLIDALPSKLQSRTTRSRRNDQEKVIMYDENGKVWDDLRGHNSMVERFSRYMSDNGGNYDMIGYWAGKQAGDSWKSAPQAYKYFLLQQRQLEADDFWWKFGVDEARQKYNEVINRFGEQTYRQTFTLWHAFNYEFVRNVEFTNNNRRRGLITLMRTEAKDVMEKNNLEVGQKSRMVRGPAESTSIYRPVYVFGTELTVQQVPHHRILGNYFLERYPGYNNAMFLGDGENEFVAMLDGLETTYKESRY